MKVTVKKGRSGRKKLGTLQFWARESKRSMLKRSWAVRIWKGRTREKRENPGENQSQTCIGRGSWKSNFREGSRISFDDGIFPDSGRKE